MIAMGGFQFWIVCILIYLIGVFVGYLLFSIDRNKNGCVHCRKWVKSQKYRHVDGIMEDSNHEWKYCPLCGTELSKIKL